MRISGFIAELDGSFDSGLVQLRYLNPR